MTITIGKFPGVQIQTLSRVGVLDVFSYKNGIHSHERLSGCCQHCCCVLNVAQCNIRTQNAVIKETDEDATRALGFPPTEALGLASRSLSVVPYQSGYRENVNQHLERQGVRISEQKRGGRISAR